MPASQNTWRVWVTSSSWVDSESNSFLSEIEPNWSSLGSGPRPAQVDTFGPDCDRGVLTCLKNCMWKHPMNFRGLGTRESTQESIRQIDKAAGNQMIATELKIRMKTRLISVTHLKKPISTTITYITYLQRQDTDWHTHVSLHLSFSDRQVRIPCRRKSDSLEAMNSFTLPSFWIGKRVKSGTGSATLACSKDSPTSPEKKKKQCRSSSRP